MKNRFLHKLLFIISALLVIGLIIRLLVDYMHYSATLNSAPFTVWVLARGIEFGIPAVIAFVFGCILRKKGK